MRDGLDEALAALDELDGVPMPVVTTANGAKPEATADDVTYRTLADIDDSPLGDLAFGMLEPGSQTVIYGSGGVGKGSTSAWLITQAQRAGQKVMVFDAEGRPREWSRRVSGLCGQRDQVVYVTHSDLPVAVIGHPLNEMIPHLARVAERTGAGILVIDSILAATGVGEERLKSDGQLPYLVMRALDATGLTSVCIGHPPKGSPEGDPYGSVSWVNASRLTWLGTTAEGKGHAVRWRPRKRNERGHIPAFLLNFEYDALGRLANCTRQDDEQNTKQWLKDMLYGRPLTLDELTEERLAEQDESPSDAATARTRERLGRALRRMHEAQEANRPDRKGGPWSLK